MQYKQQKARKESVNVQCPTFNSVGDDGMSVRAKAPQMLGDLRPRDAPAPPTHAPTTTAIAITTEIDQPTDNPQTVHSLPTNSTWQASKPSSLFPSYAPHVPLLPTYHLDAHETNKASKVLAIGFLLVILSSALWHNYLPLLVVATYVIAPVPNWICSRAQSSDDFMDGGSNAVVELGRFITGFLVVMGVGVSFSTTCWVLSGTNTSLQLSPSSLLTPA